MVEKGGGASVGIGAAEDRFKGMTKEEKQQAAGKVTDCPKGSGCLNKCHFMHMNKWCPEKGKKDGIGLACDDTCHFRHGRATGDCPYLNKGECPELKKGACPYVNHSKKNVLSVCPEWKDFAIRCPRWETCEFLHPPKNLRNQRKSSNMKPKKKARAAAEAKATAEKAAAEKGDGAKEVDEGKGTGEETTGEEAK